jgi:hypothetical protein
MGRNESGRYRRTVGAMVSKQAGMLVVLTLISMAQEMPKKDTVPVTVKYDTIYIYRVFIPREVSATITSEDVKTLESKGYKKVGSVTASYSTTSVSDKDKVPGSVEEKLLKEATARGYDVVRIDTVNAPGMIPSGSFRKGECIHQKVTHDTDCYSTVNSYWGAGKTCKPAGSSLGRCTAWEQVPILVSGLTTTGSVWRQDSTLPANFDKGYEESREEIGQERKERAEQLLAHCRACVNARDNNGLMLLHRAVMSPTTYEAEYLLAHGADINAKTNNGDTPLFLAVGPSGENMVALLLAHGADIDINAKDKHGYTPLMYAVLLGSKQVIPLLLAHGADKTLKQDGGKTAADVAQEQMDKAKNSEDRTKYQQIIQLLR